MNLTIIVATDAAGGIGIENTLPWKLPEDMAHFKKTTSGHTVLMGRKTFESIGRPLPNRKNIVISRNPDWQHEGVFVANSLEQALAQRDAATEAQVFVIGGAQIYAASLVLATRLIITRIEKNFACDAFFPDIVEQEWQEISRERHFSQQNNCHFSFIEYQRRA